MTEHNWNHFVDPTPTRLHLARLRAAGMSWAHIAELSGIHRDTLRNIDDTRRVETLTEESVLAVQPAAPEGRGANRAGPGSARRLQALIAIGWPLRWIGRHLGIDSRNLWRVVYQRAAVTGSTAAKIARTYDALWDKKPPTGTTRERIAVAKALGMARRNGWVPPIAWDESTTRKEPEWPAQSPTARRRPWLADTATPTTSGSRATATPTGCNSITSAATAGAATPTTSNQSRSKRTSAGARRVAGATGASAATSSTEPSSTAAESNGAAANARRKPKPAAVSHDIDDPAARPHIGEGRAVWGTLVENVEFLAAAGEKLPAIAARLGQPERSLKRQLLRAGRADLIRRTTPELNETHGHNRHTKGRAA